MQRFVLVLCLAPVLFAQTQPAPPLSVGKGPSAPPYFIEKGACPFECCRYGKWTSVKPLAVLQTPSKTAASVAEIPANTQFQALTGLTHTTAGVFKYLRANGPFQAGDRITLYNYIGEGHYRAWTGSGMTDFELPFVPVQEKKGPIGTWEKKPVQAWWVQVKLSDGKTGWALIASAQDLRGADGCGQ